MAAESFYCVSGQWLMAWGALDIRILGRTTRLLSRRSNLGGGNQGSSYSNPGALQISACAFCHANPYNIYACECRVDVFQGGWLLAWCVYITTHLMSGYGQLLSGRGLQTLIGAIGGGAELGLSIGLIAILECVHVLKRHGSIQQYRCSQKGSLRFVHWAGCIG